MLTLEKDMERFNDETLRPLGLQARDLVLSKRGKGNEMAMWFTGPVLGKDTIFHLWRNGTSEISVPLRCQGVPILAHTTFRAFGAEFFLDRLD